MKPIKVMSESHYKLVFIVQEKEDNKELKVLVLLDKKELEALIINLESALESFING